MNVSCAVDYISLENGLKKWFLIWVLNEHDPVLEL